MNSLSAFCAKFQQQIKTLLVAGFMLFVITPCFANASLVDSFNLAPFVPIILDSLMLVAIGMYDFFVGNGDGIIYLMIWAILGVSIVLYLVKMWFPKSWLSLFGFSGGGEMWEKNGVNGIKMGENLLKPAFRAIIATVFLLQVNPVYVTEFLVNPFLQFGSIYTKSITDSLNTGFGAAKEIECPASITEQGWISKASCDFLIKPVSEISHANNQIIKKGFEFINKGLFGLMRIIPNGGENFLNLITGIILVWTFVSSNVFMALLIIQAIIKFGLALIMYPFNVLAWVAKPPNPDKWIDLLPPFSGIIKSLQSLVITMISCAFILSINVAIIRALFRWNNSVFSATANGTANSNIPTVTNSATSFGEHSILCLSAILTFYLMFKIFELTREQIDHYTGKGSSDLYKDVTGNAKVYYNKGVGWVKNLMPKKK